MSAPAVSVIIPAYRSQRTMAGCLEALRAQTLSDHETLVVDSSPDDAVERIVREGFPEVHYEHYRQRLLPHAARNRGAEVARTDLIAFTDPDVYPHPKWLEALLQSHRSNGLITVGAIACHGKRWVDVGTHLCKFSTWLPARGPRPIDMGPTANLLCPRPLFHDLGGFEGHLLLGDATFSWRARRLGHTLWFEPRAIVVHHHVTSLRELVAERYQRGAMFAAMRAEWHRNRAPLHALYLAVSILPVRLTRILALTAARCWRAGLLSDLAATLPVVVLGHAAWLAGESRAYARMLAGRPGTPAA